VLAWGIGSGASYFVIEPAIFFLGAGLGLVMPNMTIMVQMALPTARRGVGTAMLTFFRSFGGLLGVTGSGAILAQQIHKHGLQAVTLGGEHGPLVAPAMQAATVAVYRQAIANMFGAGAVIVLVGLIALLFIPATIPPEPPSRQ
jgi:hypothetical protein